MTKSQSAASDPDLLPHPIAKTTRWQQRVVIFACLAASSGLHRNQALDRKATAQACSQFVIGTTTTGKQLEFAALRLGFLLSKNCLSGSLTSLVNLCFIFFRLVKTCFNHVNPKTPFEGNWPLIGLLFGQLMLNGTQPCHGLTGADLVVIGRIHASASPSLVHPSHIKGPQATLSLDQLAPDARLVALS